MLNRGQHRAEPGQTQRRRDQQHHKGDLWRWRKNAKRIERDREQKRCRRNHGVSGAIPATETVGCPAAQPDAGDTADKYQCAHVPRRVDQRHFKTAYQNRRQPEKHAVANHRR